MDPAPDSSIDQSISQESLQQIREEFATQYTEMKKALDEECASLKNTIKEMEAENKELRKELLRTATVPPAEQQPKEPTEEEKYASLVTDLSKKTVEMMQGIH